MPITPSEPTQALCTFTPAGGPQNGNVLNLGTEDCWIETEREAGIERYIVHAQYTGRLTDYRSIIVGAERGPVEVMPLTWDTYLNPRPLSEILVTNGEPVLIPAPTAFSGTLINPFTSLNVSGLYCTNIDFTDTGHRFVLIDFTFEKPIDPAGGGTIGTPDFTWGAINIGNQPGVWNEQVDQSFHRITVETVYNGAGMETYASDLANLLGLDALILHEVPRGAPGARGIIKSYNQTSDTLTWVSRAEAITDMYPESISVGGLANGALQLSVSFVKVR